MNRSQIHLLAHAGTSSTKACVCFGGQMRPVNTRWSKQQTTGPGFPV